MKVWQALAVASPILTCFGAGCGSSASPPTTAPSPQATAAEPSTSAASPPSSPAAEVASATSAAPAEKPAPAAQKADANRAAEKQSPIQTSKPATAAELVKAIDLRKIPRINEIRVLEDGPTYIHYSAKTTIAGADAFCSAELTSRGWKPAPGKAMVSDQYADRLFEKDGYYLRLSMGAGADEGIAGISMYSLGNVDFRALPRVNDAPAIPESTPVNVNYQSDASLADATKFCREQLAKLGWREFGPMHDPGIDVPHVKQMTWFQNAVRLDVMVAKLPDNPAGPSRIAYMAQHGLPFDLPVIDNATAVKLDLYSGRAEYQTPAPPKEVFAFYQSAGQQLGWKPQEKGTHSDEKSASMIVEDQPERGFGIAIGRKEDHTTVSLTRLSLKETPVEAEKEEPAAPQVAATEPEPPAAPEVTTPEVDKVDDLAADILKEVQKSLKGNLKGDLGNLKGDLGNLEKELQKLGNIKLPGESDDEEPKATKRAEVIEAAEETPSAEDLNLPKLETAGEVVYDGKKHVLKHAVAYLAKDSDETTPVVVLGAKPVDAQKLARLLAKGKDIWISDLYGFDVPVAMQIRLGKHQTSISAFVDGASLNISSSDKFETEVKRIGKRIRGTVRQKEPDDFFDKEYTMSASFDLGVTEADSQSAGANAELVADSDQELPVPEGTSSISKEGSKYRQTLDAQLESPLAPVANFYRKELARRGWKEVGKSAHPSSDSWKASYTGPDGKLTLELSASEENTHIKLNITNSAAAKKDGLLPKAGKGLLALGNASDEAVVFTVNGKDYKLAGGAGGQDPTEAVKVEVPPGKHVVKVKLTNGQTLTEEVQVDADTTWGALALPPNGVLAMQVF